MPVASFFCHGTNQAGAVIVGSHDLFSWDEVVLDSVLRWVFGHLFKPQCVDLFGSGFPEMVLGRGKYRSDRHGHQHSHNAHRQNVRVWPWCWIWFDFARGPAQAAQGDSSWGDDELNLAWFLKKVLGSHETTTKNHTIALSGVAPFVVILLYIVWNYRHFWNDGQRKWWSLWLCQPSDYSLLSKVFQHRPTSKIGFLIVYQQHASSRPLFLWWVLADLFCILQWKPVHNVR